MLSKHDSIQRDQVEMISLDQLLPANHLVRKWRLPLSSLYALVRDMYSEVVRSSIDPVILVKLTFVQFTFGIRSKRKTIEEAETNMAYRWFLMVSMISTSYSTFGKNFERRFKDTDLFEHFFYRILMTVADRKLISAEHVFVDSTHVKANANKRKFEKKIVRKETRGYQGLLQDEINQDRENHGKKPFPPDKFNKDQSN